MLLASQHAFRISAASSPSQTVAVENNAVENKMVLYELYELRNFLILHDHNVTKIRMFIPGFAREKRKDTR